MSYKCYVYSNSGFDASNIPKDLVTLRTVAQSVAHLETDGERLEILQQRFLSSIRVKCTWAQVEDADYCVLWIGEDISNPTDYWCYFITNVTMLAKDVAELSIVPDFITSVGGAASLTIVDGIVKRSTYALMSINLSNVDDLPTDPYLAPARPMTIVSDWIGLKGSTEIGFLSSTLDLAQLALDANLHSSKAITFTDASSSEKVTVPVPNAISPSQYITYSLNGNSFTVPGLIVYCLTDIDNNDPSTVLNGMAIARALGVEGSIINSWSIPNTLCSVTFTTHATSKVATLSGTSGNSATTNVVRDIVGNAITGSSGSINDRVKRVLNNSSFTPITMTSVSGESISADPKDLFDSGNTFSIEYKADPRPDGKPYFRFAHLNNSGTETSGKWFRNVIAGIQWQNIPLVFSEVSGSLLNTAQFSASRNIADANLNSQLASLQTTWGNAKLGFSAGNLNAQLANSTALGMADDTYDKDALWSAISPKGIVDTMWTFGGNAADRATEWQQKYAQASLDLAVAANTNATSLNQAKASYDTGVSNANLVYNAQKAADKLSYGIQQNIAVPTVMFPYNNNFLRDAHGNGILVTRAKYNTQDIERIGKIVKAFGIEYTQLANSNHFTIQTGMEYCYVDANVTIGNKPQWLANAIAAQIQGGIRIWNVKPHHITL